MLEVSTVRSPSKAEHNHHRHGVVGGFLPAGASSGCDDDFMVVDDDNLLDYIDFTCCDVHVPFFDADGDILPDLEVDPTDELLAEFDDDDACRRAHHSDGGAEEAKPPDDEQGKKKKKQEPPPCQQEEAQVVQEKDDEKKQVRAAAGGVNGKKNGDEVSSSAVTTEDSAAAGSDSSKSSSASAEGHSKKKKKSSSSAAAKNSHGKRKVKVDWTPELHRRFVQAVEQLGIDKAVPSRILEIMGIECLTRHNIASHLQKYRSHRKHLMAREAEAATWAQKRQMYAAGAGAGAPRMQGMPPAASGPWAVPPTIGFPPPPPGFGRPLHVWGHPPAAAAGEAMLPVWPRHLRPWDPSSYWHQQYNAARKWGPPSVTQGTPWVPPPMPPAPPAGMLPRFPVPAGMMPHPMYRPIPPQSSKQQLAALQLQLDAQPSKESIDAAIGDVLVKPWLPLPLGLKPPSLDSVMSELHKHGIPSIPPTTTAGT